jgi:hypothetical protein
MWGDKCGQFKASNLFCSFFILQKANKNNCKQGKNEVHLVYAMKAYSGSRGTAALPLYTQHYMEVSGQPHTPGKESL